MHLPKEPSLICIKTQTRKQSGVAFVTCKLPWENQEPAETSGLMEAKEAVLESREEQLAVVLSPPENPSASFRYFSAPIVHHRKPLIGEKEAVIQGGGSIRMSFTASKATFSST